MRTALVFVFAVLVNSAAAQTVGNFFIPQERTLWIVTSKQCPPCRAFHATMDGNPVFRKTIEDGHQVRYIDWDNPSHRAAVNGFFAIRVVPTFVQTESGRVKRCSVGFSAQDEGLAKFFEDLGIDWYGSGGPSKKQAPENQPPKKNNETGAVISQVSSTAEKEDGRIADLQEQLRSLQKKLEASIAKPDAETADAELPSLPLPLQPVPAPSSTSEKWLSLFGFVAKTAVAVFAPEVALPLTGALALLSYFRKAKKGGEAVASVARFFSPSNQRNTTEIEQILSLRKQEQRSPLHDAMFGVIFEDLARQSPEMGLSEAWQRANQRFNELAPLSAQTAVGELQTTK